MPLSNASRLADFGTGIGTAGAIIQVDNANQRLGVGTTAPAATLGVAGIVSATAFYGDGSNLDGVASAGLGTALSDEEFNPLTVIYQTSDTLSIGATITVDPPDATTKVAYTQYADIQLEDDADLIVADGDDFIPDILGLSTEGFSFNNANGNGVFDVVYTDNIENSAGRGGPNFPLGMTVSGIATFSGNVSIGGTLTYEDVTNVDSIGIVTARDGIDITGASAGVNGSSNLILKTGGTERARFNSTGKFGLGTNSGLVDILTVNDTNPKISIRDGGTERAFLQVDGADDFIINNKSISNLILKTQDTERLRIGSAGQIGLSGANYGTSGQVLTSQGASAAPQWASPSGGAWEKLGSGSATSGSTSVVTTNQLTSAYMFYKIVFRVRLSSADAFGINLSTNGGTSYTSVANGWKTAVSGRSGSGNFQINEVCDFGMLLAGNNKLYYAGEIKFNYPDGTTMKPNFLSTFAFASSVAGNSSSYGTANSTTIYNTVGAYNAIRLEASGTTFADLKWAFLGMSI